MLFSLNFLQQKISPRPKTVQKGEAIASNGISLLYILSDSCKKCGKSKGFFFFEVLRCLNYTPVRLSAAWLNPILHCCRVFWTFVVFYTLMYWLTGTGASSSGKFQIIVGWFCWGADSPRIYSEPVFPAAVISLQNPLLMVAEAVTSLLFSIFLLPKNAQ